MKNAMTWVRACVAALAVSWPIGAAAQADGLALANDNREIDFRWEESQFGDRTEPHSAILIPVRIEGCPKVLYMQFDLGAPATVLTKDKADSLAQRLPGLAAGSDGTVGRLAFAMGDIQVEARHVRVVDVNAQAGVAWDDPDRIDVIGTIGADLLAGRVLAIDYPRARMFVGDAVPEGLVAPDQARPFVFTPRGVVLTDVAIDDETRNIMLDTGSSAFALLTDQDDWLRKTDGGAGERRFPVNSWGRTLTAHMAPTRSVARFADTVVPLGEVAYIEGVSAAQAEAMRASGMGGMTGNKLFVEKILVLDAARSAYAVVDPAP